MGDRTTAAYRAAASVARALPEPVAVGAGRALGALAGQIPSDRRAQVERNLRRVHGPSFGGAELRRAVTRTFESYAKYYVESFRLPGTSPEALDAGLSYTGLEHLERALSTGKGAIMAIPHLGLWEWAGFWAAAVYEVPVTVVVERLEPASLFDWFAELRSSIGMQVVGLGPDVATVVSRALRDNHVVCLLCDRDIGGSGIPVTFFGEPTTLPAGPAMLGLRTGAAVLPTAIYDHDGHHLGVVQAPLDTSRQGKLREDVARITQELAGRLELLIRAAPEQWHLLQPNWPSDPGYRGPVASAPEDGSQPEVRP